MTKTLKDLELEMLEILRRADFNAGAAMKRVERVEQALADLRTEVRQNAVRTPEIKVEVAAPKYGWLPMLLDKIFAIRNEAGYVTYDDINAVLPPVGISAEEIETIIAILSAVGMRVVKCGWTPKRLN
ncbi:MAG: RNA polymerase sigma factor region1.1 domain-containing protein [Alphaproteobacteria bacterium]|nr:RNA polymerase sigma factor region1.1 domain-containing protein [Alphaproteobacteria bacterium]